MNISARPANPLLLNGTDTRRHTHLENGGLEEYCYTANASPITNHFGFGGVAERLIAPVLKTGRPKGLVSSNLTPSAVLVAR